MTSADLQEGPDRLFTLQIETEEFPARITTLVGETDDLTPLVFVPEVLTGANNYLREASWRGGAFSEQAVVFLGKVFKTRAGRNWIQVRRFIPVQDPSLTSSSEFRFSYDNWAAIQNALKIYRQQQKAESMLNMRIIGWGHTHPVGWEARFSGEDRQSHQTYFAVNRPEVFMYIFGAGNKYAAVDVGDTLTSTHAFFSAGGGGSGGELLRQHKGIYVYTQPLLDIRVAPTVPIRVVR